MFLCGSFVRLQTVCVFAGAFLAARAVFCVAANLTTNELINRAKYTYLNHEVVGYCNR